MELGARTTRLPGQGRGSVCGSALAQLDQLALTPPAKGHHFVSDHNLITAEQSLRAGSPSGLLGWAQTGALPALWSLGMWGSSCTGQGVFSQHWLGVLPGKRPSIACLRRELPGSGGERCEVVFGAYSEGTQHAGEVCF